MTNPHYWVARNKDGSISMFGLEPKRGEDQWIEKGCSYIEELVEDYYPGLTWENSPIRCELVPVGGYVNGKI